MNIDLVKKKISTCNPIERTGSRLCNQTFQISPKKTLSTKNSTTFQINHAVKYQTNFESTCAIGRYFLKNAIFDNEAYLWVRVYEERGC